MTAADRSEERTASARAAGPFDSADAVGPVDVVVLAGGTGRRLDGASKPDVVARGLRLLDHVRARLVEFQEETDHMYNLEATPAEGTTYRFAKEDRKRFPGILQAGTPANPYYTNSSQLPVNFTDDPFEALERQDDLHRKYTGGTVLHLYMNEAVSSPEACRDLVRRTLTRFRLPYITVTPTFSICPKHGYLSGRHDFCPKCDAELLAKKRAKAAREEAS